MAHPLIISSRQDLIENYLGKFPVLSIDFGGVKTGANPEFETFVKLLAANIQITYNENAHLIDTLDGISNHDGKRGRQLQARSYITIFERLLQNDPGAKLADKIADLTGSLRNLVDILKFTTGNRVYLSYFE